MINDAGSIELDDWCIIEKNKENKTPFENTENMIRLTNESLDLLKNSIENHNKQWIRSELTNDYKNVKSSLSTLDKLKILTAPEREKLIPQLSKTYQILADLKKIILDNETKKLVATYQNFMKTQCAGIGKDLCDVRALLPLAENLNAKSNPENYLLKVNGDLSKESISLELIPISSQKSINHQATYNYLQNVYTYLKKESVIKHLSADELIKTKSAVNWLMINYFKALDSRTDLAEHIFSQLRDLNSVLNQRLAQLPAEELNQISEPSSLYNLNEYVTHQLFFPDFWSNPKHVEELKQYEAAIKACKEFLSDSHGLSISGLKFIKRDDKHGLALYEELNTDEKLPKTLILFSFNKEGIINYYNCLQTRKSELELGGLGHQPVLDQAEVCWKAFNQMIEDSEYKGKETHLKAVGFGLDGAVAQILSYLWAVENPKAQTRCYGLGVAPFLDCNAAAKIGKCPNHYAIDFKLLSDRMLGSSVFSKYVAKEYQETNFQAAYTLHFRDWVMSDLTGHDQKIYSEVIKPGVRYPQQFFEFYQELHEFTNIIGTTRLDQAGSALQELFKKYKESQL